jgi:hypothetical protein
MAMAAALAVGLVLALAAEARGAFWAPIGLTVTGGGEWRAENDFEVFWTNPVEAQVVGAGWRLDSADLAVAASFVPGFGLSELGGLRVPAAGSWSLTVWLRDADGSESPRFGSTVLLRFDDLAPAVAFMPGDADAVPAQLVAAVADPLSGVAAGTISYRRLDETRWTDLPTAIRAGVFATELAAARPELRPGTAYEFRAEASDHAGNVAATTLRADGAPMQFAAPGDSGGRDSGRRDSGGRGNRGRGDGRPARLLAGLAGGRRPGRGRRGLTVDAGEPVLLRGALTDRDGGLEDRRLRIVIRPADGASAGRQVVPVTTGSSGRFELRLPPGPSRRLTVVFAGEEDLRPARRRLELRVRAAVSLRAEPRRLRTGGRLRLEGRVGSRGARVPGAGKLVTISYWEREAHRWRPVIVTRTDRGGRFRVSYRFRYVTGRARIRLRAQAPAEAQWPYAPGASPPLTIEVRG